MFHATNVVRREEAAGLEWADSVTLDHAGRYRRRFFMKTDNGVGLLLDLPRAVRLEPGDALVADSTFVLVQGLEEDLLKIVAWDRHGLTRVAWHLGNRHTPAEVCADAIYIQYDRIIADMLSGMNMRTERVKRVFLPEGGAYDHHA